MLKLTAIRAWTVSAALFTCVGCVGAPEASETEAAEPSGTPGEVLGPDPAMVEAVPAPTSPRGHADAPQRVNPPASPEATNVMGKLHNALAPTARESVCITFGEDLDVLAIDEIECSTVDLPHLGPTLFCAGCIMDLAPAANGGWILAARPGSDTCEAFAGSYLVGFGDDAKACSMSHGHPCGDGFCPACAP